MDTKDKPIRIVTADDQHLVRQGFRAMLECLPSMQVVAEASTGQEAIDQYARHQPDILLLDLRLPDMCGVHVIRAVREKFLIARIIVLTTYDGDDEIYQSLQAGAKAYLLKDITMEELADCIEKGPPGPDLGVAARRRQAGRADGQPGVDRAGTGRAAADRRWAQQQGDRRRPGHHRRDRQESRQPRPRQAGRPRPHPGGGHSPEAGYRPHGVNLHSRPSVGETPHASPVSIES
jgi:CheY-like chemotaxis protein